jgi:hypothetical protein
VSQPPQQYPYPPADQAGQVLHRPQGAAAGSDATQAVPGQRGADTGQHAALPGQATIGAPRAEVGYQAYPLAEGAGQGSAQAQAQAQAAQQAAGAVLTRGSGDALATPPPPPSPRGTVYQHTGQAPPNAPSRRLARLRIGSHVATPAALDLMTAPSPGAGLLVGADRDRAPVLVRLFRPEPTEVVLVGGVWAARLLAFRVLAQGAAVFTVTPQPAPWDGLGAHAVGHHERVHLSTVEPARLAPAAPHQPVLVIRDTTGGSRAPLGPWQTRLTVVRQLDHNTMTALPTADLTIMQRLAADEAQLASYSLRMSAQSTQLVQLLEPEMVALMGGGANRYVWLNLTGVERQLLGAPQR